MPKATRRARKRVRGNAEAWGSTLQKTVVCGNGGGCGDGGAWRVASDALLHPTLLNGLRDGKGEKFAKTMDAVRQYEATAPEDTRFFCYVDCHDTVLGDGDRRFDRVHSVEAGNAAFVLVFLRRGLTVVYNGNEIADNVKGSIFMPNDRKRERTRINWARALMIPGQQRLAHIRALAKLRHENPVFADGTQELGPWGYVVVDISL